LLIPQGGTEPQKLRKEKMFSHSGTEAGKLKWRRMEKLSIG
jgi:hypothetical protein